MLCFTRMDNMLDDMIVKNSHFYLCGAAKESKAPIHAAYGTMFIQFFFHLHQNMHATILRTFLRYINV